MSSPARAGRPSLLVPLRWGEDVRSVLLAALLALPAGVAWTYLAYETSLLKALVVPVAVALVGVIAWLGTEIIS
jgi:hypothetical protein